MLVRYLHLQHHNWLAATLFALFGLLLLGPLAQAQEPQQTAPKLTQFSVQVAAIGLDKVPAKAEVQFSGRIGPNPVNQTLAVDEEGKATLGFEPDAEVRNLWFTARAPGFVPVHYVWRNNHGPIQLPELQPVELETAVTIAGRIVDEQGQPIAGATVDISMPITWPKVNNYYFNLGTAVTDDDGQWKFENAPEDMSRSSIRVEHPEYLRNYVRGSKDLSTTTLKRGLTIAGRVLDAKGDPLAAARVRHGNDRFGTDDPMATTDAQGNFKLLNCKAGSTAVTVEAEGFSPQFQTVDLTEGEPHQQSELEFRLKPGNTLKMKVVDSRGRPVDGVTVVSDTWRGLRTLDFRTKTGADGTVQWNNAPPDAVLFDILKSGYMAARNTSLVAGGEEQVVTLYPELVISGRVLNAETKKNVESFRIIRGQKQESGSEIYWYDSESQDFTNGKFSYRISEPMLAWQIEISAEGYRPVKSREFKSNEGDATFNVLLELARGPTGTVVDRDGNPVADAEVVLASNDRRAQFQMGHFDSDPSKAEQVFSDATGRFTFSPQEAEQYVVVAVHDSGFAQVTNRELSENPQLRLEPWGKIDGQVRGGSGTDTNCDVSFYSQRLDTERALSRMVGLNYRTHTDAEGHFTMDRVLPGPGSAARVVVIEDGEMTIHSNRSQTPVEVVADQTSRVNIGGGGRAVKGHFVLNRQPAEDVRWRHEPTVSLEKIDPETGNRDLFSSACRSINHANR